MTEANRSHDDVLENLVRQHQLEAVWLAYALTRQANQAPELAQACLPAPGMEFRLRWFSALRVAAGPHSGDADDGEDPHWLTDPSGQESVRDREMRGLIWEALGGLSSANRAVIALRLLLGLTNSEASQVLGCPTEVGVQRYRNAKRQLAESLARASEDAGEGEYHGLFEEETINRALRTQASLALPPGRNYIDASGPIAQVVSDVQPRFSLSRSVVVRLSAVAAALCFIGLAIAGVSWFGRPPEVAPTLAPTARAAVDSQTDECGIGFEKGALSRIGRGAIQQVMWSPGGDSLVARSTAGLFVYDAATLRLKTCRPGNDEIIGWSPKGDVVALYNPVRQAFTLQAIGDLSAPPAATLSLPARDYVAASYDFTRDRVAVIDTKLQLQLFDAKQAAPIAQPAFTGTPLDVRFSPDGNWLVIQESARRISILDLQTGSAPRIISTTSSVSGQWVFSGDSTKLILSDQGGGLSIDIRSGAMITGLRDGQGFSRPLWANADGSVIGLLSFTSTREDSAFVLYDVGTRKATSRLALSGGRTTSLAGALTADGKRLAIIGTDGFSVWDVERRALVNAVAGFATTAQISARAIAYSPDGQQLAVARSGGTIALLDVASGRLLRQIATTLRQPVQLQWSPDGRRLVAEDSGFAGRGDAQTDVISGLYVYDLQDQGRNTQYFPGGSQARFSDQGGILYYRPREGNEVRYYTFDTGTHTSFFVPQSSGDLTAFDTWTLSPDQSHIAFVRSPRLEVWERPQRRQLAVMADALTLVSRRTGTTTLRISMSPDNKSVLVASPQDGVKVINWSPPSVRYVVALPGAPSAGTTNNPQTPTVVAAFSPDGRLVASLTPIAGALGSTLAIHENATGVNLLSRDFAVYANGLAFSPDGTRLAYLTSDDVVGIINLTTLP